MNDGTADETPRPFNLPRAADAALNHAVAQLSEISESLNEINISIKKFLNHEDERIVRADRENAAFSELLSEKGLMKPTAPKPPSVTCMDPYCPACEDIVE